MNTSSVWVAYLNNTELKIFNFFEKLNKIFFSLMRRFIIQEALNINFYWLLLVFITKKIRLD